MYYKRLFSIIVILTLICTFLSSVSVFAGGFTITIDGKTADTTSTAVEKMRGEKIVVKGDTGGEANIIIMITNPKNNLVLNTSYEATKYINGIEILIDNSETYYPLGVYEVKVGYNGKEVKAYFKVVESPVVVTPTLTLTLASNIVTKGNKLGGISGVVTPAGTAPLTYAVTDGSGTKMSWGGGTVEASGIDSSGKFTIPEFDVPSSAATGDYTLTVSGPDNKPSKSAVFTVKSSGGGSSSPNTTSYYKDTTTETKKVGEVVTGSTQTSSGTTYEITSIPNVGGGNGLGFNISAKVSGVVSSKTDPVKVVIYNQQLPAGSSVYTLMAYYVSDDGTLIPEPKTRVDTTNSQFIFETDKVGKVVFKDSKKTFADVDKFEPWSVNYISALAARGFIVGAENGKFEPERNITRAELVAILVRAFELKGTGNNTNFKDINSTDWYSSFVAIASENGIVNGVSADEFKPDQNVTREELVTMLGRAASKLGIKLPVKNEGSRFKDADSFENYSVDYAAMMQKAGIVEGKADNIFDPKANATRAEVCKVIWGIFDLTF